MTNTTSFRFNRNYKDHEQVAPFFPAYLARLEQLEAAGKYPYNDSFKGHIPGIEGPDEDSAIYLLQGLRALNELDVKISAYLADGYEALDDVPVTPRKYAGIVEYGWYVGGTGCREWKDARLIGSGQRGSAFVLPKGKRTNGHYVTGKVLVKL